MSHLTIVGGGSESHLRAKKHKHHLVWVTHGYSAITVKIGEKNLKSPLPNICAHDGEKREATVSPSLEGASQMT